jgi:hypothetical protein
MVGGRNSGSTSRQYVFSSMPEWLAHRPHASATVKTSAMCYMSFRHSLPCRSCLSKVSHGYRISHIAMTGPEARKQKQAESDMIPDWQML